MQRVDCWIAYLQLGRPIYTSIVQLRYCITSNTTYHALSSRRYWKKDRFSLCLHYFPLCIEKNYICPDISAIFCRPSDQFKPPCSVFLILIICSCRYQYPRVRRSTFGARAFAIAGPTVWNSLPDSLRDPAVGSDQFRRDLKTHLFERHCVSFSALAVFSRNALYKSTFYLLTYFTYYHFRGLTIEVIKNRPNCPSRWIQQ